MRNCPIAGQLPPYIPAPIGALGSCTCNIGLFADHFKVNRPGAGEKFQCTKAMDGFKAAGTCQPNCENEEKICRCCTNSSATSAFFNTCPTTDPTDIYIFPVLGYNHLISAECTSSLGPRPNCASAPYNFTISPGSGSNDQFFDAATIFKSGTTQLTNKAGGLATPVSGAIFTWSLYDGGVTTANATVTTWTGAGATTPGSSAGSVTSASRTSGTLRPSSIASATPTTCTKSSGWKNFPSVGLLFLGNCLLFLAM